MIVAYWGSDVQLSPPDIWQWGPWIGLILAVILASVPVILDRLKRRDIADEERRKRADEVDQARRDAADKERREQATLLLQHLQTAATNAQRRMEDQEAKFLSALEQRDKQAAEQNARTVEALRSLTTAVDSLQRRQQR